MFGHGTRYGSRGFSGCDERVNFWKRVDRWVERLWSILVEVLGLSRGVDSKERAVFIIPGLDGTASRGALVVPMLHRSQTELRPMFFICISTVMLTTQQCSSSMIVNKKIRPLSLYSSLSFLSDSISRYNSSNSPLRLNRQTLNRRGLDGSLDRRSNSSWRRLR